MNITQPPTWPIAEAIHGYMRDRTILVNSIKDISRAWDKYDVMRKEVNDEIAQIDEKVKDILNRFESPSSVETASSTPPPPSKTNQGNPPA